ncbi:hypothetical protein [Fibrobacter sp. UWB13]|uniref:hypothetical protein n=1 Tax=Fibrobacter sp. UWB13 TaxID=1896204 RepID=UPI00111C5398|nr:hypothetical protein [Fibrobacter sp. UWB13]
MGSIIMEYAVINVLFLLQKGKDGALGLKKRVFEPFWAVFASNCIIGLYHNMIRIVFSYTFWIFMRPVLPLNMFFLWLFENFCLLKFVFL